MLGALEDLSRRISVPLNHVNLMGSGSWQSGGHRTRNRSGEAGLFWNGSQHEVFACEGGHADFAPQGDLQIDLLRFLADRYGHVSYERVLSGPGLVNVYEFLRAKGCAEEPAGFAAQVTGGNAAATISHAALEGEQSR